MANTLSIPRLAQAYHSAFISNQDPVNENFIEYEGEISEIIRNADPRAGFDLILACISENNDPKYLAYIGAGPIEDWMGIHQQQALELVAAELGTNAELKIALQSVWQNEMEDKVFNALRLLLN